MGSLPSRVVEENFIFDGTEENDLFKSMIKSDEI